jgi:hypothetical protein
MPDEWLFREEAREGLRSGKLPLTRPIRTFGGPGNARLCSVCSQPIEPDQMELACEFDRHGQGSALHRFHQRCFAAWELERTKVPGVSF